ncbi:MAG TPA: AMP-binding protein, partial [Candidatus Methylacidiphilales bacterium]|nr:AMP-binding protein [Candidatus Methylacidiphilales bacterium]
THTAVVRGVENAAPAAHIFGNPLFFLPLFGLGVFGAMFVVPLNAYMQEHARPSERGRVMSSSGLVLNMTTILAIIAQGIITANGVPTRWQYVLFALPTICVAAYVMYLLPENFIRFTIGLFARFIYKIRPVREDKLPETGGVLLLTNHLSIRDAILLQLACPRNIRFVIFDPVVQGRLLNRLMRIMRCIPISPGKAKSAVDAALEALEAGEVVCLFPEHSLMRASALQELNGLQGLLARKSKAPIVPVWLENTWSEAARTPNTVVNVYFGEPMPAEMPLMEIRARLYDLGEEAFSARPELHSHLGAQVLKGLKSKFFRPVVVDTFKGDTITGGKLLAASLSLAGWLKENVKDKRIGIILPPGIGATVANVACVFANKTSVNLNFTLDRASNETCIRKAGVSTVISVPGLWDKLPDFPWPANRIDMAATMKSIPGGTLKKWFITALLCPVELLRVIAGVPKLGGHDEASLLFTSGSSGEPKGVVLSHRNILANTMQIQSMLADVHVGTVLGCLPIFHSYGSTVTLWWPVLGGPQVVTHISPRETSRLIEIIAEHKIHLLITTPTFLRHYIRKAKPEQLASLKMVVTGAEKLPLEVASEFQKAVKLPVCEGYGMTEATPVVAVNLLDTPPSATQPEGVRNRTVGSVGRLLPGISVRIRHPETDAELPIDQSGILWLKGANVFEGYLDDPNRTADVLKDGWYRTGDVGRMDDKGFLYIEGRISRFSKIGGEMIPHGTIEAKIEELFGLTDHDTPIVVVTGVPDEAKGESLVILSTQPLEISEIRSRLSAAGYPNLWIPRVIYQVETMPVMATGKLNLAECQRLALDLVKDKRQSAGVTA